MTVRGDHFVKRHKGLIRLKNPKPKTPKVESIKRVPLKQEVLLSFSCKFASVRDVCKCRTDKIKITVCDIK